MVLEYICEQDMLLKEYLVYLGLSRRFCKRVKLYGKMMINGEIALNFYPVKKGDKITLEFNENTNEEILTQNSDLDVVYEDQNILIINKKENIATQPSKRHYYNNIISMIKGYFEEKGINSNVHVVTRLDYATSGLMVIAKNGFMHYALTKEKTINRYYYALVEGIIPEKEGVINLPIARSNDVIKREVNENGKEAITNYKVIKEDKNKNLSLVKVNLVTGRTHQIRVHFSYLGYPLVGDKLYNPNYSDEERLYLHSYKVEFINPSTNELVSKVAIPDFYNYI